MKTIGILGGMGPTATVDLLNKIYLYNRANCEQDYVHVIADIDPSVPDRSTAIKEENYKPVVDRLAGMTRGLIGQGAELFAAACNTAHFFLPEVESLLSVKFVSMIEVTLDAVDKQDNVALLATDGTVTAGLYHRNDQPFMLPDQVHQELLMKAIYTLKAGNKSEGVLMARKVYEHMRNRGAAEFIAACTELPILLNGLDNIIDPTGLLARKLVEMASAVR